MARSTKRQGHPSVAPTGAEVAKRQVEQLAARAARDFDAFYDSRVAASPTEVAKTAPILVLTTDGKGVVMRPESLRVAAGKRQRKLRKRLAKGEKTATRRMATVASVYTIVPFYRTPEDIVRHLDGGNREAVPRPRPENKRVWASVTKATDRRPRGYVRRGRPARPEAPQNMGRPGRRQRDTAPADQGDRREARPSRSRSSSMSSTSLSTCGTRRTASTTREHPTPRSGSAARLLEILRGKSSDVAAGIRRSATLRGLPSKERAAADACAGYLLKYRAHVDYHLSLAAGLPIATGVIEGAGRHLVKDRMDLSSVVFAARTM